MGGREERGELNNERKGERGRRVCGAVERKRTIN